MTIHCRTRMHAIRALTALIATGAISSALAQGETVAPPQNGAMTFPNVRVVEVAPVTSTAPRSRPAWRAYLDPDTGMLTAPSPEDVQELEAAMAQPTAKRLRKTMSFVTHRSGAIGVEVDEEVASYSVVRKTAEGRLVEACVVGEALAEKLIRTGVVEFAGVTR